MNDGKVTLESRGMMEDARKIGKSGKPWYLCR